MVASDSFTEFLREQLAPLGRVTMRRMLSPEEEQLSMKARQRRTMS
jgi:hypothetical protein